MNVCLCFCCFSNVYIVSECDIFIECIICGDKCYSVLLYKDRWLIFRLENGVVNFKCIIFCELIGGLFCSKILLVDIFNKCIFYIMKCIYVIVDE